MILMPENACVVCIRVLLSASICLSTLQKHEGCFVLILKSAWGVLSTLYFWAWGVLSAFKKTCGGFRPPITKWTWGVLSVGCFVLHSSCTQDFQDFFSKGDNSERGHNSEKKKIRVIFFFMRNPYIKFQDTSIHCLKVSNFIRKW